MQLKFMLPALRTREPWYACRVETFPWPIFKAGGRVAKHSGRLKLYVARVVTPFWNRLVACLSRWKLPARFPPPRGARVRAWMPPPRHAFLHEVRRC
jgi:hypothetical protein